MGGWHLRWGSHLFTGHSSMTNKSQKLLKRPWLKWSDKQSIDRAINSLVLISFSIFAPLITFSLDDYNKMTTTIIIIMNYNISCSNVVWREGTTLSVSWLIPLTINTKSGWVSFYRLCLNFNSIEKKFVVVERKWYASGFLLFMSFPPMFCPLFLVSENIHAQHDFLCK